MSVLTMYNFDSDNPTQITREEYVNVGSSKFQLGTAARGFKDDLEVWDSPSGGTQLTVDVDYEIDDIDEEATAEAGYNVYTRAKVLNATYQTGSIYITYKAVLSYPDADYFNDIVFDVNAKTLTSADSPYTISDSDLFTDYDCDTSSGSIVINLPTLADNYNKLIRITHNIKGSTNTVTINPEGSDNLDGGRLSSIVMAQQNNTIQLYASQQATSWEIKDSSLPFYVKVSDQKTSGTNGGNFTSGAWQTRTINTEDSDDQNIASISSNQITLEAGTYTCFISAPGTLVGLHKARLYDTTGGGVVLLLGQNAGTDTSGTLINTDNSLICGQFTLTIQSVLEVQHRCSNTNANGFGSACSFGVNEVYTVAEFWRK
jgi:hypothetical protein